MLVRQRHVPLTFAILDVTILPVQLDHLVTSSVFDDGELRALLLEPLHPLLVFLGTLGKALLLESILSFLDQFTLGYAALQRRMRFNLSRRANHIDRPLPVHVPLLLRIDSEVTRRLRPLVCLVYSHLVRLEGRLDVQVLDLHLLRALRAVFIHVLVDAIVVQLGPVSVGLLALDLSLLDVAHALPIVPIDLLQVSPSPPYIVVVGRLHELLPMLQLLRHLLLHVLLILNDLLLPFSALLLLFKVLRHTLHRIIKKVAASDFLAISRVAVECVGVCEDVR